MVYIYIVYIVFFVVLVILLVCVFVVSFFLVFFLSRTYWENYANIFLFLSLIFLSRSKLWYEEEAMKLRNYETSTYYLHIYIDFKIASKICMMMMMMVVIIDNIYNISIYIYIWSLQCEAMISWLIKLTYF